MTTHRSFGRIVATGAAFMTAATVLAACGGGSHSANSGKSGNSGKEYTDTIHIGVFPSFSALAVSSDEAKKEFAKEGLKVQFVTVATPADAAPQLVGGKLQFALMDMTTPILAASQNTNFTLVAPVTKGTPVEKDGWGTANIWVKAGSPIKNLKELTGKTIGVPAINSQIQLDIRTAVDAAGGDSSKIKWVETGRTGVDQVKSGAVDATTTAEPSGTAMANDPKLRRLAGYASAGGNLAFEFTATKQFADANPDVVKKFEAAVLADNKAIDAAPLSAKVAAAQLLMPTAPKALLQKARYSSFQETPISAANVNAAIERMKKYGMLESGKAPKAADLLPGSK